MQEDKNNKAARNLANLFLGTMFTGATMFGIGACSEDPVTPEEPKDPKKDTTLDDTTKNDTTQNGVDTTITEPSTFAWDTIELINTRHNGGLEITHNMLLNSFDENNNAFPYDTVQARIGVSNNDSYKKDGFGFLSEIALANDNPLNNKNWEGLTEDEATAVVNIKLVFNMDYHAHQYSLPRGTHRGLPTQGGDFMLGYAETSVEGIKDENGKTMPFLFGGDSTHAIAVTKVSSKMREQTWGQTYGLPEGEERIQGTWIKITGEDHNGYPLNTNYSNDLEGWGGTYYADDPEIVDRGWAWDWPDEGERYFKTLVHFLDTYADMVKIEENDPKTGVTREIAPEEFDFDFNLLKDSLRTDRDEQRILTIWAQYKTNFQNTVDEEFYILGHTQSEDTPEGYPDNIPLNKIGPELN